MVSGIFKTESVSRHQYLKKSDQIDAKLFLIVLALVLLRYWLTAGLPLTAHAQGTFDDELFIRLAESVVSGEWLGAYDMLTLVKAPLYSLFIAANYLLGLQFKTMEHTIYIFASVLFFMALLKSRVNPYLALVPFILLLFNPYFHSSVERGWFYAGLVFLVFSGIFYMISLRMLTQSIRPLHSFLLGVGFSMLYLSREETIWLYPWMAIAFAVLFYQPEREKVLRLMGKTLPLLILGIALPILVVLTANYTKYGHFGVKDSAVKEFNAAFKLMKSVRTKEEKPFVDITHNAFSKMFEVSPTLAQYQPYLEGNIGKKWGTLMCRRHTEVCGEIGGGYVYWALREASAAQGYFQSPEKMKSVYSQISDELKNGCLNGQLDCTRSAWPLRFPIRQERIDDYLMKLPYFIAYMVSGLHGYLPSYGVAHGPENRISVFQKLSNTSVKPKSKKDLFSVSGWLISEGREKYIAIVPKPFTAYTNQFSLLSSPDVQRHFQTMPNSDLSRFRVEGQCKAGNCELLVMSGNEMIKLDQSMIRSGADIKRDGLHLHIDSVKQKKSNHKLFQIDQIKIAAFKKIGRIYNKALIYLTALATLIFVIACVGYFVKNYRTLLLWAALIVVIGIGTRLGVLILFDEYTQSPVIGQIRHFIPIMPFLLLYIGLSFLILFELPEIMKRTSRKQLKVNNPEPAYKGAE
jgi:hypothetical protein